MVSCIFFFFGLLVGTFHFSVSDVEFFLYFFTVGDPHGEKKDTSKLPGIRTTNVELQLLQVTHWFNQLVMLVLLTK